MQNPYYAGQLHDMIADDCLPDENNYVDENDDSESRLSSSPSMAVVNPKSAMYTRLLEHALDDLDIAHTLAHSRHPVSGKTALDCCSPRFRPLLLERMFLMGRYKRGSSNLLHHTNSSPNIKANARGEMERESATTTTTATYPAHDGSVIWSLLCLDLQELLSPPKNVGLVFFESYGLFIIEKLQVGPPAPQLLRTHNITQDPGFRRSIELQLLERVLQVEGAAERVSYIMVLDVSNTKELEQVLGAMVPRFTTGHVGELRQSPRDTVEG